ncbi:MAG: hypothetical protein PF569_03900 [Candidatus Woesearchaeota archaeon]|jgi:flagellar basal body P-ring protein FlgI|nr:hypothetical protein [Candidatus Woesearchaeota archaeon]
MRNIKQEFENQCKKLQLDYDFEQFDYQYMEEETNMAFKLYESLVNKPLVYPSKVQSKINLLDKYTLNSDLKEFNVIHLYPKDIAYPDGYYDSRFFDLHCFNTNKQEKCIIENRDGILIPNEDVNVWQTKIYADGSTLIQFRQTVTSDFLQCSIITKVGKLV